TEPWVADGIGGGSVLFATWAMWAFGMNAISLLLFFLLVLGLSVAAFTVRFRDTRLIYVPLLILALSVFLLTPINLSTFGTDQAPIGGNRFFSVAAILPALHICLELWDGGPYRAREIACLVAQGILLFGALLVRSSAGYLVGVIGWIALWMALSHKRHRAG